MRAKEPPNKLFDADAELASLSLTLLPNGERVINGQPRAHFEWAVSTLTRFPWRCVMRHNKADAPWSRKSKPTEPSS
jgi:hypothetical protein